MTRFSVFTVHDLNLSPEERQVWGGLGATPETSPRLESLRVGTFGEIYDVSIRPDRISMAKSEHHENAKDEARKDLAKAISEGLVNVHVGSASGVGGGGRIPFRETTGVAPFTLSTDGDLLERRCCGAFLSAHFPAYEKFWLEHVVPLTNRHKRRDDINFMSQAELTSRGKTLEDVCIAQLHYTVLLHLARGHDLNSLVGSPVGFDGLQEGIVRLVGALDVANELLQRRSNLGQYLPFLPKASEKARRDWKSPNSNLVRLLRVYRNDLVHGSVLPALVHDVIYAPRINVQSKYYDWRTVTACPDPEKLRGGDFLPVSEILSNAWLDVVDYCQEKWTSHLT